MTETDPYEESTFETLVGRLDEIANALDSSEAGLDEALQLYEEGAAILRIARQRLAEAEGRIRQLRESESGEIYAERLAGDAETG